MPEPPHRPDKCWIKAVDWALFSEKPIWYSGVRFDGEISLKSFCNWALDAEVRAKDKAGSIPLPDFPRASKAPPMLASLEVDPNCAKVNAPVVTSTWFAV